MVSKIAVIALVAIVACPILIGYAMNINEVTVQDYKVSGESVNVTPLYQNGTGYSYTMADLYSLNTNFLQGSYAAPSGAPSKILPDYQKISTTRSSIPVYVRTNYPAGQYPVDGGAFSSFTYLYFISDFDGVNGGSLRLTINNASIESWTYGRLHTFYYESSTSTAYITYYSPSVPQLLVAVQVPVADSYTFSITVYSGVYNSTGQLMFALRNNFSSSVNLSGGYRLTQPAIPDDSSLNDNILNTNAIRLDLPEYPNSVLLTMDLSTISNSSYDLIYSLKGYGSFSDYYTLRKTTDSSGIHWELYKGRPYTGLNKITDLYYDSSRLSNTYQIYIDNTGMEYRYIGNWPSLIGPANAYQVFRYDRDYNYYIGGLKDIEFWNTTPVMRVDASEYRAYEYPIIEDQIYNPASFKTNPSTKITNKVICGNSLEFGGNTYNVTDGNITLGLHKIPIEGMVLDSIPNDNGMYDNRINGTKVSESANPATITFNGKWSVSISTTSQEQYEYAKTEWIAGDFAWDGIDQNFLMVGLLASLGAFIALGIYARMSRSSIWPLLIVCGGAALLFFVML